MTAALIVAAALVVLAAVVLYRASRARETPRSAPAAVVAVPDTGYDVLGQGTLSAAGGGAPESGVFFGEASPADGPAFLGVLVDGIGDAAATERIRSVALRIFLNGMRGTPAESAPLADRLMASLEAAHREVREVAEETGLEVGASLTAAVVRRDGLHWISVGNSRLYLYRDEVLHQVTMDQTFGAMLARSVMQEQLSPDEASAKQERDALTSYVGAAAPLQLDRGRRPLPLRQGDRVILCSQGVYGKIPPSEMVAICGAADGGCSATLVERALQASSANLPPLAAIDFAFHAAGTDIDFAPDRQTLDSRTTLRMSDSTDEPARVRAG